MQDIDDCIQKLMQECDAKISADFRKKRALHELEEARPWARATRSRTLAGAGA